MMISTTMIGRIRNGGSATCTTAAMKNLFKKQQSIAITIRRNFSSSNNGGGNWTQQIIPATDGFPLNVSLYSPTPSTATTTTINNKKKAILCFPGALGTGPSDFGGGNSLLNGRLGNDFDIVAIDPRGLGGSRRRRHRHRNNNNGVVLERTFPLDFYLRDALDGATVMEQLGYTTTANSNYVVAGWSDGANSAMQLAAHDANSGKGNVSELIVWGGNAYVTSQDVTEWEKLRNIDENWSQRMKEKMMELHFGGEKEEEEESGGDESSASMAKLQELNNAAIDGWIRMYTENGGDVCLGALHQINCPTLILHGGKDVICNIKHPKYIANQISDSKLVVIPEGKHNLHQSKQTSDEFHKLVSQFLLQDTTEEDHHQKEEEEQQLQPAIDQIAYAFMGSKALATALKAGVFDAIHHHHHHHQETTTAGRNEGEGGATFSQIEDRSDIKGERLKTLLNACVSIHLIRRRVRFGEDIFTLPQASIEQLVTTSKHYWGDYIANQVDSQFYNRMNNLDRVLRTGDTESDGYETWFDSDPEAAKKYTLAQHNGSLATAYALHRRVFRDYDLRNRFPSNLKMLDVGGGSGAFSIVTCRKIPHAECVVLDLPNVIKVAKEIIEQEEEEEKETNNNDTTTTTTTRSVKNRITTASLPPNDAGNWDGLLQDEDYEIVLMSYVSGSIPLQALSGLYSNAYKALKPGGVAILHDFFVDNDGAGPTNAALWALAHTTVNPDGMGLRPNRIVQLLMEAGFVAPKIDGLIPKTTQTIVATKPLHSKL